MSYRNLPILILVLAFTLSGCGRQATTSNEIVIGEFASLTGPTADFGKTTNNGVQLALEEINAAGGVLGKKVRLIVQDDRSDAAEARTVVTKLVLQDRVVAHWEVASKRTLRRGRCASRTNSIAPSSTNPRHGRDYVFGLRIDDFRSNQGGVRRQEVKQGQRAARQERL
jgi:branched-chain amino acid transport system substrate-binding protein